LSIPLSQLPQKGSTWWGTFDFEAPAFDWGPDYNRPSHSLSELVIYEMSVRCFTASETSGVQEDRRGTYLGVADKVGGLVGAEGAAVLC
jgi:isoamylase